MENKELRSAGQVANEVLTAIKEPSTKGLPSSTILKRFKRIAAFNTLQDPQLEVMLEETARFAASLNFVHQPYWLTLSGKTGVGKTHLARAVYRQFMDQNRFEVKLDRVQNRIVGNTASYVDWRKFCDDIRSGGYSWIDDLCEEWFVILDDVGSERDPSGFIASALDRILNSRLDKWTMITTNLSLKDVAEKIDVRVASRMLRNNGVVVENTCVDYNLRSQNT